MANVYQFKSRRVGANINLELANQILLRMDEGTRESMHQSVMEAAKLAYAYRTPAELMRKALEINLHLEDPGPQLA